MSGSPAPAGAPPKRPVTTKTQARRRKSRILQSLVEEHIRTGEPVSSQAILDHSDLDVSSATIRNELAALEGYGFITQPHTSSGRIPTRQGYRYYVDHGSPGQLRVATHARIEAFFADVHREVSRLLKETSRTCHALAFVQQGRRVALGQGPALPGNKAGRERWADRRSQRQTGRCSGQGRGRRPGCMLMADRCLRAQHGDASQRNSTVPVRSTRP